MAEIQELLLETNISQIENDRFKSDVLLEDTLSKTLFDNNLTKREIEILNLILIGNTNKEISQKISRTERTIEYHRNRLMHKLGTKTAAELVKKAITLGLV
ncbi:MAG: helix-turn-helix transcriptional regulator [Phycisphaerales bacterium]